MITKKLSSFVLGALFLAQGFAPAADARAPQRYRTLNPIVSISPAYYAGSQLVGHKTPSKKSSHRSRSGAYHYGGGSGDYLSQVGGDTRWPEGKTIRVYIPGGRYKNFVANAFNQWTRATGGRLSWTLTGDPNSADYSFSWTGTQREVSTGTEAGLTTTNTAVNGDGSEVIEHAHTRVLTRLDGHQIGDKDISETILHEVGHGLGLEGHSSNPRDIMYYAAVQGQGGLTARDLNTIAKLYAR